MAPPLMPRSLLIPSARAAEIPRRVLPAVAPVLRQQVLQTGRAPAQLSLCLRPGAIGVK